MISSEMERNIGIAFIGVAGQGLKMILTGNNEGLKDINEVLMVLNTIKNIKEEIEDEEVYSILQTKAEEERK